MIIRNPAKAAPTPVAADKSLGDTHTNLKPIDTQTQKPSVSQPPPMPAPEASSPPAAPAAGPGGLREAAIQVLSGAAAGRTLDLTKNLTTIGKPGLQVAVITKRPNGYFITHVEGATYPTLNGASLGAQAHLLGDHDLIEIAGVKMEFFYKP
jgi:hypothetical protein